jgi:DNA repair exonuclease SbcCD ATPase subunit
MRHIYLPELLSIHLKNYTLYPNGLDYAFDFIKGINLVLGGNGMGKTTFVNIIKYSIIGNYKKQFDYTRTYKDRIIERRTQLPPGFFSNRMSASISSDKEPIVEISFRINGIIFEVVRGLREITILSLKVNGISITGDIINQYEYEKLGENQKKQYLLNLYESEVEKYSNLSFDDLIFFVNEVLFFGEDHRTILWNNGSLRQDVQTELFNKYFNDPKLDRQRQEAERQAKYYDSLSRHRSEDMRAINKVLSHLQNKDEQLKAPLRLLEVRSQLEDIKAKIDDAQRSRTSISNKINILQNEINKTGAEVSDVERERERLEGLRYSKMWEGKHHLYQVFEQNIRINHICPMCNRVDNNLAVRVDSHPDDCLMCGRPMKVNSDKDLNQSYQNVLVASAQKYSSIANQKKEISKLEEELQSYDSQFRNYDSERRKLTEELRNLEYANAKDNQQNNDILPFVSEIERLQAEKDKYQKLSESERKKAESISNQIDEEIKNNVKRFSYLFSSFAEKFLGVTCQLTFDKNDTDDARRFYPVIDGITRYYEEELSESQRFFIDHSFRMSILTFFYTTPTFYIVETPDSSLDISYEYNAARVFIKFLEQPNTIIITSNLNNSSFVNFLIQSGCNETALVDLLSIAKQSEIQNTSDQMMIIYNEIKNNLKDGHKFSAHE